MNLMNLWRLQMLRDRIASKRRGATAVEYGLMVALIAVAIIAVVILLGGNLRDVFFEISDSLMNRAR